MHRRKSPLYAGCSLYRLAVWHRSFSDLVPTPVCILLQSGKRDGSNVAYR
jgi:hypothetical protein